MTSDDDALASVVARGVAASSSWSLDEACARAVSGRHLDDVGGAIRDAAPCVLAVERWLASLPEGTPGATVVEMCGSESGHVAGMLLASILPPGAAREVVLVDARWPADAHSSSSSSLPVAHVDTPPVPGTYRAQLTRWKATAKNASHLRSLHRALRGATAGDAAPLVVVSRRAPGTDALRAMQMYFAPAHGPVALVLEPGAPPTASPPSTENSSTAPVHRTRSRRARYTRAKVAAATADDPPGTSPPPPPPTRPSVDSRATSPSPRAARRRTSTRVPSSRLETPAMRFELPTIRSGPSRSA